MRRSESFHHVSHVARKDQCSSRGGSDSGIFYVTDYDLEPQMVRTLQDVPTSPNSHLTKSLDRIDEGLDSIVDIIITEEKQHWNILGRLAQEKSSKSRTRSEEKNVVRTKQKQNLNQNQDQNQSRKELKSDELYNGYGGKQLRNDELYELDQRQWHHQQQQQEEVNGLRKSHRLESPDDNLAMPQSRTGSRPDSFSYEKTSKFSGRPNESGIFAGRPYDAFGLGKNRFNAGKYSGNHLPKQSVGGVRNSTSSVSTKHGKVTDVLSGLY